MAQSDLMKAGVLGVLVVGLVSCESTNDVTSPDGSSPRAWGVDTTGALSPQLVGTWLLHDSSAAGSGRWQLELKGDGRYASCTGEVRYFGARIDTLRPYRCDTGTWSDLGAVSAVYGDLSPQFANPTKREAMFRASRLVMIKGALKGPPNGIAFDHHGGMVLSPMGDSLTFWGNFGIFQGAGRRLDSTLWCHPGGRIDSLFLAANGIAKARVVGISGMTGEWSSDSSKSLHATFITEKAANGSYSQSVSIGGRVGFLGSNLILMDGEDFAGLRKVASVGP